MANIKQVIKQSKVHQYEIAEYLGYNEFSLSRKLRKPVDADFERKILLAIRELTLEKERGQADAGITKLNWKTDFQFAKVNPCS